MKCSYITGKSKGVEVRVEDEYEFAHSIAMHRFCKNNQVKPTGYVLHKINTASVVLKKNSITNKM